MNHIAICIISCMALALVAACGGAAPPPTIATASTDGQAALGATLYAEKCSACHGDKGEGRGKTPPVVGANGLPLDPPPTAKKRTAQFKTVADVFQFTKATMPADEPGSLSDEECWAILAFQLQASGKQLAHEKLDASNAAAMNLRP